MSASVVHQRSSREVFASRRKARRYGGKRRGDPFWTVSSGRGLNAKRTHQASLRRSSVGLNNALLQGGKLSDGLEPSTPSLPWKFEGISRVHRRSPKGTKSLQMGANRS